MKTTIIEKEDSKFSILVFDMPRHTFGVDRDGIVYYRGFSSLHKFNNSPESWELREDRRNMPSIKVKLLNPGDKIVLEVE